MKRRVKRKMLLVGMAVAAHLPVGAVAQGIGKVERQGHHYASSVGPGMPGSDLADLIQEAPEMRIDANEGGAQSTLLNKLKGIAARLGSRVETVAVAEQAWKLEVAQSEPAHLGLTDHPKTNPGKPVGVALRLKF